MRAQGYSDVLKAILFAAAIAACGGSSRNQQPTTATTTGDQAMADQDMAQTAPAAGTEDCDYDLDMTGASVRAVDIEGGVALVFTSDGGDTSGLQSRVRTFARAHAGAGSAAGQGGATGTGVGNSVVEPTTPDRGTTGTTTGTTTTGTTDKTKTPGTPPPPGGDTSQDIAGGTTSSDTYPVRDTISGVPAVASVVDTATGVQLELRAQDPADIARLRSHARDQVTELSSVACQHGGATPPAG